MDRLVEQWAELISYSDVHKTPRAELFYPGDILGRGAVESGRMGMSTTL